MFDRSAIGSIKHCHFIIRKNTWPLKNTVRSPKLSSETFEMPVANLMTRQLIKLCSARLTKLQGHLHDWCWSGPESTAAMYLPVYLKPSTLWYGDNDMVHADDWLTYENLLAKQCVCLSGCSRCCSVCVTQVTCILCMRGAHVCLSAAHRTKPLGCGTFELPRLSTSSQVHLQVSAWNSPHFLCAALPSLNIPSLHCMVGILPQNCSIF